MPELQNGGLLGGRVSTRELVYVVGVIAGLAGSWYGLTARVDRIGHDIEIESRRVTTFEQGQSHRMDALATGLADHLASSGHPVGLERGEQLTRRLDALEHRMERCHCAAGPDGR